jgi:AGZA family xanthine/uracil permease-like MFS transporter
MAIKYGTPDIVSPAAFSELLNKAGRFLPEILVTVALGNGFIVTAMLWGGFLAELIDRHLRRSVIYLSILSFLAFFGVVHSAMPDGSMYMPWTLSGLARQIPYQFALGYAALALLIFGLSYTKGAKEAPVEPGH